MSDERDIRFSFIATINICSRQKRHFFQLKTSRQGPVVESLATFLQGCFNLFTTIHDGNFRRHSSMNLAIK